jgi:spermidine synthase
MGCFIPYAGVPPDRQETFRRRTSRPVLATGHFSPISVTIFRQMFDVLSPQPTARAIHAATDQDLGLMKPRELVGTAIVPGGDELRLFRHSDDYMIVLGANQLMSSRMSGSEEALARMTCERLRDDAAPHLLLGGYGMGFTLRAALAFLGPGSQVTVAELVPEIIDWARGPMATLTGGCLDDPRVHLVAGDVAAVIAAAVSCYDAILLDVDNGPDGLTRAANDKIYSMKGLALAKAALKPGGILAIWSAAPDAIFSRRLKDAGFKVEELSVRARSNGKGPRHVLWFARRR